jgi:hypothetical protein
VSAWWLISVGRSVARSPPAHRAPTNLEQDLDVVERLGMDDIVAAMRARDGLASTFQPMDLEGTGERIDEPEMRDAFPVPGGLRDFEMERPTFDARPASGDPRAP